MLIAKFDITSLMSFKGKKPKVYAKQGDELIERNRSVCADNDKEFVLLVKNVRTNELFHTRSCNVMEYTPIKKEDLPPPKPNYKIELDQPLPEYSKFVSTKKQRELAKKKGGQQSLF
mgnify:CR=1 FL=1